MIRKEGFAVEQQLFRITVGHISLLVQAASEAQAVREARKRMCTEMPRMWDVIERLEEDRFRVDRV